MKSITLKICAAATVIPTTVKKKAHVLIYIPPVCAKSFQKKAGGFDLFSAYRGISTIIRINTANRQYTKKGQSILRSSELRKGFYLDADCAAKFYAVTAAKKVARKPFWLQLSGL